MTQSQQAEIADFLHFLNIITDCDFPHAYDFEPIGRIPMLSQVSAYEYIHYTSDGDLVVLDVVFPSSTQVEDLITYLKELSCNTQTDG
jgi:hypothetical protein